jgi:hypothetical protein
MYTTQAAYQLLLTAQQRNGDPVTAVLEIALVCAGLYFYGFRL